MFDIQATAMRHIEKLCVEIGSRPIGSPANQAAADYVRNSFGAAGCQVEEQPYACTAWEHTSTMLELSGERLDVVANAFSLPCEVTAPVVAAGTIPELEAAPASGRILLLYGDLVRNPLSAKSWFLKGERDERIIQTLEILKPAALLAPPTATDYYGQWTEDWELDLPAATVPYDVALRLLRLGETPVRLCIESRRVSSSARNLVARTAGSGDKRIVLCAHFDTKINTPGALDNGSGAAVLLTLAEMLAPGTWPFTLEFIAFNGEEYLPLGDDEYLRRAQGYFGNILAAINLDMVGAALGANSITAMSCTAEFEAQIKGLAARYPGVVWVEPWPESNHSTFSMRGVPGIALSSVGMRGLTHSRGDTIEHVSPTALVEAINLVKEIVASLQQN
jgi:Iap family predicted aminopeptidase